MEKREYYVLVERDGNGGFKGDVAQFFSCKSRGKTLDDLMVNMRKAIGNAAQKGCEAIDTELNVGDVPSTGYSRIYTGEKGILCSCRRMVQKADILALPQNSRAA